MNRADTLRETCFDPLFAGPTISCRLLEAVSRPGAVLSLGEATLVVPPPDLRPAYAVLLAVLDRDVTFHVTDPDASEMRDYLRFNSGACIAGPEHADFVLVSGPSAGDTLDAIMGGGSDPTDDGVRLVYAPRRLDPLETRADVVLELAGPGVVEGRRLSLGGIAVTDFERLTAARPAVRPVDLWFASADGWVAAIPRTTRWHLAR